MASIAGKLTKGEYAAIDNELHLIRSMTGSGLTALHSARFDNIGAYYDAFFAITIALERVFKMTMAIDARVRSGAFPNAAKLKTYGHDLVVLRSEVSGIAAGAGLNLKWSQPSGNFNDNVISYLNDFAAAGRDRYFNLNQLASGVAAIGAPPAKWFALISSELSPKQRTLTPNQVKAVEMNRLLDQMGFMLIRFQTESGDPLTTSESVTRHVFLSERVQKLGVMACIQQLRYALHVLVRAFDSAHHLEPPSVSEYFTLLLNGDSYLRTRKTFTS